MEKRRLSHLGHARWQANVEGFEKAHKSAPEKRSWNTKLADRRDARAFYACVRSVSVLGARAFWGAYV